MKFYSEALLLSDHVALLLSKFTGVEELGILFHSKFEDKYPPSTIRIRF